MRSMDGNTDAGASAKASEAVRALVPCHIRMAVRSNVSFRIMIALSKNLSAPFAAASFFEYFKCVVGISEVFASLPVIEPVVFLLRFRAAVGHLAVIFVGACDFTLDAFSHEIGTFK